MNEQKRGRLAKRLLVPVVAMGTVSGGVLAVTAAPASATPYVYSCSFYVNINIFGGGYKSQGCPTQTDPAATANTLSIAQTGAGSQTDLNGSKSVFGPAVLFSSPYDPSDNTFNSGRLDVNNSAHSTGGSAVARATTVGPSPFFTWSPGYAGPWAAPAATNWTAPSTTPGFVEARCNNSGTTEWGSTTIKNGYIDTVTGADGYPTTTVAVAQTPAANTRVDFIMHNTGDSGYIVLNEQKTGYGMLNVNGMRMVMNGPSAYGEMIIGKATCGG